MSQGLSSQNATKLNKSLQNRYETTQSKFYQRLSVLSIKIHKTTDEAYLTEEEIERLDHLDEFLKAGGMIKDYTEGTESGLTVSESGLELKDAPEDYEALQVNQFTGNEPAFEMIHDAAQSKAAGQLILQNLLSGQYLNNP